MNSYCVEGWNQFECLCSPGWQGDDCTNSTDDCLGVDCGHGYCEDLHLNHTCVCDYGYTGEGCNVELSACDVIPCWANQTAECVATPPLQFICVCLSGYHGDICNVDINECDSDPCFNGASCVDLVNGYECACTDGWAGPTCTIDIDECADQPCESSSQCVDQLIGYVCICAPGLTGANCSLDIKECAQSPCMFGSECVESEPGAFECVCPEYLTGSHCEHVRAVNFLNSTLLKLPPLPDRNAVTTIEFIFTTSLTEPRLLYAIMNEQLYQSLTVKLDHSALLLTLYAGLYSPSVSIGAPITAQQYQLITQQVLIRLLWLEGKIQLLLPPSSTVYEEDVDLGTVQLNSSVYIADITRYTPFTRILAGTSSPFIGCFSDYIVNNQPISLWTSAVLSNSLALGCGRAALCDHSSCSHAGTCTDYWSHSNCTCLPGYAGNSCDVQTFAEFSSPDSLRFSFFSNLIKVRMVIVSSPQSSGVVFYTLPESSSALALYINGSLINLVTLTLGQRLINSIELVNVSQASLCSLEVQLRSLTQTLAVRCGDVALTSAVDYKQPLEFTGPLFIGSVSLASAQQLWSDSLWSTNSITACIGQVIVNDLLLDLSQGVADVSSPIPGCTGDSNCQLSSVDCSGNGQCVVSMDTGKRCECADGFVGISCAETEPLTFDGLTSFWSLRLDLSAIAFNGSGSFAFRTRASSGTLLHLQSQSHRLQFSINSQGRLVVTTPTEEVHSLVTSLNDGSWHSVSWASSPLVVNINVSLSSKMVFSGSYGAWYDNLDVTAIVGAHPSDRASIPTDYWKGCVSSLTLGNTLIPIQSLPEGVTQTRRNVVNGCHGDVQCISADICPENAYCVEEWNSYNCSCEEGWEGPSCQTSVNDCLSHRCVNGDCIDGHKSYRCQCYHGFTGADCNEREYLCLTGQTQCSLTNTQACIDLFPLNYTCQCKLGWTGIHCTEEVNECLSNPCLNGASCVDRENLYTCTCPEEYFGKLCENKHICSSSPCNNNATCVPSDDNSLYVCKCTERYLGERCDIFNSCYLNECLHGSTCLSDSINRVYSCSCPTGYYGNRCELRDYCLDNRCQNGAECINAGNKYECVCTYHYIGEFCSTLRDKCEDNSCMNGARCTFDPQTPESSYRCVCAPGYVGEMCEMEVDECNSSPCVQGTCTDTLAGYTCSCLSGWHGNNCHLNINECSSSPCMNRGECDDGVNGYTCTCAQGYRGLHCELDYRGCRSSPCLHGATCVSQGADNSYECICVPGYAEMLCQTNIDDCVGNLCQSSSTCVDLVQDYRCDCLPGYSGQYCTDKLDSCYGSPCNNGAACSYVGLCSCEEVNEFCGFHDENCQRNRCQALAGCSLRSTSYSCDCSSTGFSGSICSIDIDECADGTHTCGTNSMCVNDAGSFHCDCEGTGYRGDNCHIDIDECSELSGRNRCNNGGTCINRPGSYSCICLDGWTGPDCTFDIQECISSPCAHNSTCIEGVNGYLCVCAGGYTGPRCLQNINECQDENICRNGGICVDIIGSYQCVCTSHWSGDHCDIQVDRITPTMTYSRATETDSATISSSTKTNTSASTLASVAGKNNHTVLTITLTLLVVILCAATVVVVLYQRRCLPQQAMKGSYRPDSMTTLPMSVQYKSDHRQVLI